jgi:serine/threonine protein phosphatase PrpC
MRFGIASRPALGMRANGDTYLVEQCDDRTFMAVIDGLGHGEEAAVVAKMSREFIAAKRSLDLKQTILDLHRHLDRSRGVVAGLVRIDSQERKLRFCGIGNTEVRVISEPRMHPASLDGILGANVRKVVVFEYPYKSLKAVVLHSDGISSGFDLSDYPSICEEPQAVADTIMTKWGKQYDDATIAIGVND